MFKMLFGLILLVIVLIEKCYFESKILQCGTVCFVQLHEKNLVTCFNDMQQVIETGLGNVTRAWIG